jgi:hypothetical protein
VRGHLAAALTAVPSEGNAPLKRMIDQALDAVEKLDQWREA